MEPSVGRTVHYVSYGSPGGEFASECRAAIITEVGRHEGVVSLAVLNPSGMYFQQHLLQDETGKARGTWHWPERLPEPEPDRQWLDEDGNPAMHGDPTKSVMRRLRAEHDD